MSFYSNSKDKDFIQYLKQGEFGLEKESLRVDAKGYLSHTLHPFPEDPERERDFCENQLEIITGVYRGVEGSWKELADIHNKTVRELLRLPTGKEYLWAFSNPPYLRDENDVRIAKYEGLSEYKTRYREYLAQKYGKKKMLLSGVHINFSFPEELIKHEVEKQSEYSFVDYKNRMYLELAEKTLEYSWFIVFLTSASSVWDKSYLDEKRCGITAVGPYASIRCSEEGYWNAFVPSLNFGSIEEYIDSISRYVEDGSLAAASELYYPVRLKPRAEYNLDNLKNDGVNHLELRMFDLNPMSPVGIDIRDLHFLSYFLIYLASQPRHILSEENKLQAIINMQEAAKLNEDEANVVLDGCNSNIHLAAQQVFAEMEKCLLQYFSSDEFMQCFDYQKEKLRDKENRYCHKIARIYGEDYVKKGLKLLETYSHKIEKYSFYGWQHAICSPVTDEYLGINTPMDLYDALTDIWKADTCAPRMRQNWTEENRTLGQCSITAFLVQDIFGGEVRGILRPAGNYHCFNAIGELDFDLTSEQFGDETLDFDTYQIQTREEHFKKQEKYERYLLLKHRLKEYCEKRQRE